jgi:hypothetical protein
MKIEIDRFKPRDYQQNLVNAFEEGSKKRYMVIWPRRARQGYLCVLTSY